MYIKISWIKKGETHFRIIELNLQEYQYIHRTVVQTNQKAAVLRMSIEAVSKTEESPLTLSNAHLQEKLMFTAWF